jgi:hypothetical protein
MPTSTSTTGCAAQRRRPDTAGTRPNRRRGDSAVTSTHRLSRGRVPAGAFTDVLVLVLVAVLTYAVAVSLALFQDLRAWSEAHRYPLSDELVVVSVAVVLTFALLGWSRARREVAEHRASLYCPGRRPRQNAR